MMDDNEKVIERRQERTENNINDGMDDSRWFIP
jgi:hypothetical protein